MKNLLLLYFVFCFYSTFAQNVASKLVKMPNAQVPITTLSDLFVTKNGQGFSMPLRKNGPQIPLFSSAGLWMGGKDRAGNLKVAATLKTMSTDVDFASGPLDDKGQTTIENIKNFNKIFTVTGDEIRAHKKAYIKAMQNKTKINCDSIPDNIKYWPAEGNPYWKQISNFEFYYNGATFFDADYDDKYNPCNGDFPLPPNMYCNYFEAKVPEQINFWMFNDNYIQRLTDNEPIQIQVNAYQYNYAAKDETNDVSFFTYDIINKADDDIRDFYIGMFIDPALGCPYDDKIAFDTLNSTFVFYNGNKIDGKNKVCDGQIKLNEYPYSIALNFKEDFLRMPKVFAKDKDGKYIYDQHGVKKYEDPKPDTGEVDTLVNGKISSFRVFDNCNTGVDGDCDIIYDDLTAYNLLRGLDVSGDTFMYQGVPNKIMFTGNPIDPNQWSMVTDTTFNNKNISALFSAGPMLLQPGQKNRFDFSVNLIPMKQDVPDMNVVRFQTDKANEVLFNCIDERGLGLRGTSLNFYNNKEEEKILIDIVKEDYVESLKERTINYDESLMDSLENEPYYKFEGYMVYQVKDPKGKFNDENYKLIYQCDIQNEFDVLYNLEPELYETDDNIMHREWQRKAKVFGANKGLEYSFEVNKDYFASPNDDALIDGKTYYYGVRTYNACNWHDADLINGFGEREQFWAGYPRVSSHYYSTTYTSNKIKYYCENGNLSLIDLQKGDRIKIYNAVGTVLINYTHDGDASPKIFELPSNITIIFVERTNVVTGQKEIYKVVCK